MTAPYFSIVIPTHDRFEMTIDFMLSNVKLCSGFVL